MKTDQRIQWHQEKEERTECCNALTTFMDDGLGGWVLCCKVCCEEI